MKALREYEPVLSKIMLSLAKETHFYCKPALSEILKDNPRLVVAFNHASPLSWLPAISLLCAHVCARGGGSRRPMGVMDRFFFALPGLRFLAQQLTQTDSPLGFKELVRKFKSSEGNDVVIFPEGSNCFFGDPKALQPFRSPRFVELAIRTHTPILICAHRGSEHWATALPIPEPFFDKIELLPKVAADFLSERLRKTGLFTLPLIPKAMEHFEMRCELYKPTLTEADLSENKEKRRQQIADEAEMIHQKFQSLLSEIDAHRAATKQIG